MTVATPTHTVMIIRGLGEQAYVGNSDIITRRGRCTRGTKLGTVCT